MMKSKVPSMDASIIMRALVGGGGQWKQGRIHDF